jgi:bidirectional [NiFe] hydrogenase diaphorase subunit
MLTLTLNGREVQAEPGETILQVARREGVPIPTLCDHEGVEPASVCRLCLVELSDGRRSRLVTACSYPLTQSGLAVQTDSERVLRSRRMIMELLLARCPGSEQLRAIAAEMGVAASRFAARDDDERCILCGLCERVCQDAVKVRGIARADRGIHRRITAPFDEPPEACTGCGACAFVCPTGAIESTTVGRLLKIAPWGAEVELAECTVCGTPFAPRLALERAAQQLGFEPEYLSVCGACRQTKHGRDLGLARQMAEHRAGRHSDREP